MDEGNRHDDRASAIEDADPCTRHLLDDTSDSEELFSDLYLCVTTDRSCECWRDPYLPCRRPREDELTIERICIVHPDDRREEWISRPDHQ